MLKQLINQLMHQKPANIVQTCSPQTKISTNYDTPLFQSANPTFVPQQPGTFGDGQQHPQHSSTSCSTFPPYLYGMCFKC